MADENVEALHEKLLGDADLRAQFAEDPAGVAREHGIDLDDDQEARLTGESWDELSDDEIVAKIQTTGLGFWF